MVKCVPCGGSAAARPWRGGSRCPGACLAPRMCVCMAGPLKHRTPQARASGGREASIVVRRCRIGGAVAFGVVQVSNVVPAATAAAPPPPRPSRPPPPPDNPPPSTPPPPPPHRRRRRGGGGHAAAAKHVVSTLRRAYRLAGGWGLHGVLFVTRKPLVVFR